MRINRCRVWFAVSTILYSGDIFMSLAIEIRITCVSRSQSVRSYQCHPVVCDLSLQSRQWVANLRMLYLKWAGCDETRRLRTSWIGQTSRKRWVAGTKKMKVKWPKKEARANSFNRCKGRSFQKKSGCITKKFERTWCRCSSWICVYLLAHGFCL